MNPTPAPTLPQPITVRWALDSASPGSLVATDLPTLEAALDELHDRATDADRPRLISLYPTPTRPLDGHVPQTDDQTTTGPILAITVGASQAIVTWTYLQRDASPLAIVSTSGTTNDESSLDVDDANGGRSEFPAWMLIPMTTARAAVRAFATDPNAPPGGITWAQW